MQKVVTNIITFLMYIAAIGIAFLIVGFVWYGVISIWNSIF